MSVVTPKRAPREPSNKTQTPVAELVVEERESPPPMDGWIYSALPSARTPKI